MSAEAVYKGGSAPGSGKFYSFAANKPSTSKSSGVGVHNEKPISRQELLAAKAEVQAIQQARASELAARGGKPVSASERTQLAMQQAYRYGVGIAPQYHDVSPTTVVDASGRRTEVNRLAAYQAQASSFGGGRPAQDVRQYGSWQNQVSQQEAERQANKASWQASQPQKDRYDYIPKELSATGFTLKLISGRESQPQSLAIKNTDLVKGWSFRNLSGEGTVFEQRTPKALNTPEQEQKQNDNTNLRSSNRDTSNIPLALLLNPSSKKVPQQSGFKPFSFGQTPQQISNTFTDNLNSLKSATQNSNRTSAFESLFQGSGVKPFLQIITSMNEKKGNAKTPMDWLLGKVPEGKAKTSYIEKFDKPLQKYIKSDIIIPKSEMPGAVKQVAISSVFLGGGVPAAIIGGVLTTKQGIETVKNPTPKNFWNTVFIGAGTIGAGLEVPKFFDVASRKFKIPVEEVAEPQALAGGYPSTKAHNTAGLIEEFRKGNYGMTSEPGMTRGMLAKLKATTDPFITKIKTSLGMKERFIEYGGTEWNVREGVYGAKQKAISLIDQAGKPVDAGLRTIKRTGNVLGEKLVSLLPEKKPLQYGSKGYNLREGLFTLKQEGTSLLNQAGKPFDVGLRSVKRAGNKVSDFVISKIPKLPELQYGGIRLNALERLNVLKREGSALLEVAGKPMNAGVRSVKRTGNVLSEKISNIIPKLPEIQYGGMRLNALEGLQNIKQRGSALLEASGKPISAGVRSVKRTGNRISDKIVSLFPEKKPLQYGSTGYNLREGVYNLKQEGAALLEASGKPFDIGLRTIKRTGNKISDFVISKIPKLPETTYGKAGYNFREGIFNIKQEGSSLLDQAGKPFDAGIRTIKRTGNIISEKVSGLIPKLPETTYGKAGYNFREGIFNLKQEGTSIIESAGKPINTGLRSIKRTGNILGEKIENVNPFKITKEVSKTENPEFVRLQKITSEPGGHHMNVGGLPEDVTITRGETEGGTGIHIGPSASLKFARMNGEAGTITFSLLPKSARPFDQWIGLGDVGRIPKEIRSQGTEPMLKWLETEGAKKNKGFISPAFELGKTEKEGLVTGYMKRVQSNEVITGLSKPIPLNRYEKVFPGEEITPQIIRDTKTFNKEAASTKSYYSGERNIALSDVMGRLSVSAQKNYNKNYSEIISSKQPSSNIPKSDILLSSPISSKYPAPESKIVPSAGSSNYKGSYVMKLPSSGRIPSKSSGSKVSVSKSSPGPSSPSSSPLSSSTSPKASSSLSSVILSKIPPSEIIRPLRPSLKSVSSPENRSSGFFVVFREHGREVKANSSPMSYEKALAFGRDVTKQSITASFKVVHENPANLQFSRRVIYATGAGVNPFNFRQGMGAKTKGFFVEKPKYRIGGRGAKIELKQSRKKKGSLIW